MNVSIVIPTYNGSARIGRTLDALRRQTYKGPVEVIVVDDGSTDNIAAKVASYPGIRLISQKNSGPALARNAGARAASGDIVLFTDDDCVPADDWLDKMLGVFSDPAVVGAKGAYTSSQPEIVARFVQAEYEDKFARMKRYDHIDFIDTYSAAFRRDVFLRYNGYDVSFPVACAEDVELSYRMKRDGLAMKFVPDATVSHTHPASFVGYVRKKFKYAYWRVYAVALNPHMLPGDSHTPHLMKFQLLLSGVTVLAAAAAIAIPGAGALAAASAGLFIVSTLPFCWRVIGRDAVLAAVSPAILFARGLAQLCGVLAGTLDLFRYSRLANVRR